MAVEIIAILAKALAKSVTVIEHRRDAIEAEPIEMEFGEPILTIREQEMYNLVFAIIEAETIPSWMLVAIARIEILVRVASQIAESLHLILHGVRMHDVHNHGDAILMGCVYELLQLFRGTEATAGCKEATYVIAK